MESWWWCIVLSHPYTSLHAVVLELQNLHVVKYEMYNVKYTLLKKKCILISSSSLGNPGHWPWPRTMFSLSNGLGRLGSMTYEKCVIALTHSELKGIFTHPSRQLTVHWQPTMLKFQKESDFHLPQSQNCLQGFCTLLSHSQNKMLKRCCRRRFWYFPHRLHVDVEDFSQRI